MKRIWIQIAALLAVVGLCSSCQPLKNQNGDIKVTVSSLAILLDVAATSCSADPTSGGGDIAALHTNLGRLRLEWKPPSATATLKIAYIRIKLISPGIAEGAKVFTIGSEELNCIMKSGVAADPTLDSTAPAFTFSRDLKVGGIGARDPSLSSSFSGTGEVLVYGLLTNDGKDTQYTGTTAFDFTFEGFF